MSTGEIRICNSALIKIGVEPIVSFSEQTKAARFCNIQYETIRDELLSAHYWNFAMARVALAQVSTPPLFGFDYAYQLPADCLRVRQIEENDAKFKIEGRLLYTDSATANIQYVSKNTDASQYSPYFKEALASRLAADLAYPMVQSVSLSEKMFQKHQFLLVEARAFDGQEGDIDQFQEDVWLESRVGIADGVGNVEV